MSSRRSLILIAAVVIGALAAYAVVTYVDGIEDRVAEDNEPRRVLLVKGPIPRGMTGQEARVAGLIDEDERIANRFFPATAIDPDAIDIILAKVAISDLAANQVIVEGMFVDRVDANITAARRLTPGYVAITISVDDVAGVAGLIEPGDYVNIMVGDPEDGCAEDLEAAAGAGVGPAAELPSGIELTTVLCDVARYLYQEVQVLFVDKDPVTLPGEAVTTPAAGTSEEPVASGGLITLQVPPLAAQYIASTSDYYLTLLPENYTPGPLPQLDPLIATLPGEDPAQLTPCGPNGCDFDSAP